LPESFHVPKRLARLIRQQPFEIKWNEDFAEIIRQCSLERVKGSWINQAMIDAYTEWHQAGETFCLSVHKDNKLVGGIYGVQRGGLFAAESMFSRLPNASSVAVVVLMAGLVHAGIELVDVQFANAHSAKFNITEIENQTYLDELARLKSKDVILKPTDFSYETAIEFLKREIQL
jgi:leucyl/phenylalanyl-tRNA--protein transferase